MLDVVLHHRLRARRLEELRGAQAPTAVQELVVMYVLSHLHRPLIKGEIILVFEVILPQHCRHAKRLLRRLLVGPEKDAAPQVLHLVGSQAAEAVASLPDALKS